MIRGIHYFTAELKTKIDVIPRSSFNSDDNIIKVDWIQPRLQYLHELVINVGDIYNTFNPLTAGAAYIRVFIFIITLCTTF